MVCLAVSPGFEVVSFPVVVVALVFCLFVCLFYFIFLFFSGTVVQILGNRPEVGGENWPGQTA